MVVQSTVARYTGYIRSPVCKKLYAHYGGFLSLQVPVPERRREHPPLPPGVRLAPRDGDGADGCDGILSSKKKLQTELHFSIQPVFFHGSVWPLSFAGAAPLRPPPHPHRRCEFVFQFQVGSGKFRGGKTLFCFPADRCLGSLAAPTSWPASWCCRPA